MTGVMDSGEILHSGRGPDDFTRDGECEGGCGDWYHSSCVGCEKEQELLDPFVLPQNVAQITFL